MRPEEALGEARRRADDRRTRGVYGEPTALPLDATVGSERPSLELIGEWAEIHVEPAGTYSTRRLGAPITLLKRLLLRLMRQYLGELEASQTRFNIALLSRYRDLEERVERLERGHPERAAGLERAAREP